MIKRIIDIFGVSVKKVSDYQKVKKDIKDILESFKREGIDFCILRNPNNLERQKDLDILIKNKKDIRNIMKRFGFRRRSSYGPYVSYKRRDIWLDFKVGCLAYNGFCFENASSILSRKKKYKYYFILNENDEFVHLILHSILFKRYFKPKYKKRISFLLKIINRQGVVKKLEDKFYGDGEILFNLIIKKDYKKALNMREKLFKRVFNLRGVFSFCMMWLVSTYGTMLQKITK